MVGGLQPCHPWRYAKQYTDQTSAWVEHGGLGVRPARSVATGLHSRGGQYYRYLATRLWFATVCRADSVSSRVNVFAQIQYTFHCSV
jgi:hypothetical protein